MEQIYKDLYVDEEGKYCFVNDNGKRMVVDQQSYLLVYLLEVMLNGKT